MTGCVHGIIKSSFSLASGIVALTMVVSVTDPKLLIKILQVTFTGGPAERNKNIAIHMEAKNATSSTSVQMTGDVNKNKMMVRVQKKMFTQRFIVIAFPLVF